MGILSPAFRKKRGGQNTLLMPAVVKEPLAQNNPMPKGHIVRWYILLAFTLIGHFKEVKIKTEGPA